jgi:hypothetical protein
MATLDRLARDEVVEVAWEGPDGIAVVGRALLVLRLDPDAIEVRDLLLP